MTAPEQPERCPRCNGRIGWAWFSTAALPEAEIMICGDCMLDEADRSALGFAPVPPEQWPVPRVGAPLDELPDLPDEWGR